VYAALFHLGTPDPATDRWLFLHDFELAFTCAAGSGQCAPASDTDTGTQTDAGHDQPGDAGGCACAARTGDRAPGLALLVLAALGRRRASRRGASR
jgi:MYXO-CTERM domain-containing protein